MHVHIFQSGELYALTPLADGSNLPPNGQAWKRQTDVLLADGETPFGIDASRAIADVHDKGYHVVAVDEVLARSMHLC